MSKKFSKRSKRNYKKRNSRKMKGGDASNHAISVFGGIGQQQAGVIGDNTIAMKGGDASDHAISVFGGIGQQQAAGVGSNAIAMKGGGWLDFLTTNPTQPSDTTQPPATTPEQTQSSQPEQDTNQKTWLQKLGLSKGGNKMYSFMNGGADEDKLLDGGEHHINEFLNNGGAHELKKLLNGGSPLANIAVPAILLFMNQVAKKKKLA